MSRRSPSKHGNKNRKRINHKQTKGRKSKRKITKRKNTKQRKNKNKRTKPRGRTKQKYRKTNKYGGDILDVQQFIDELNKITEGEGIVIVDLEGNELKEGPIKPPFTGGNGEVYKVKDEEVERLVPG